MKVAGNNVVNDTIVKDDDGFEKAIEEIVAYCGSHVEAIQTRELLDYGGFSIVDYNLNPAKDILATDEEADEYLDILDSMLNASSQAERDELLRLCAEGTYPSLPVFVIIAIKHVGKKAAPALVEAIHERLPEVFGIVYDYLLDDIA